MSTKHLKKRDKSHKFIWTTCSWAAKEKGRENVGVFGHKRDGDESCAQHKGSEEVDGRMDLWEVGMASRHRVCVCGYHRDVVEHAWSNQEWIEDDHREQSCWKFEEQRDR